MRMFKSTPLGTLALVLAVGASGCSRSAQDYVERGDAQLAKGNVDAAILEYRNAIDKDPRLAVARTKLADVYIKQGNGAGALGEAVRAADLLPQDAGTQVKAGALLLAARRVEDAKARADKALAADPANVDALVLRANALAGLTDLDGALKEMQQALRLDPRASLQSNLGMIQAARGNLPEAEAAFRQAVTTDPKSASAQIALGQFFWSVGKLPEAESAFKSAHALDPASGITNRALASYYLQTNRAAEAEPYFKGLAESAGAADAKLGLADYYAGTNRPADAVAVLEKLSADPRFWAVAKAKIADIQYGSGKTADAFRAADEVIAKHPALAPARIVRSRLLLADGRQDEALRDALEAVKVDPQNAEAHFLLGTIHEAKRDLDAAAKSYAEALRLNPRAAAAQVRLAGIALQRNSPASAVQLADQAASQQPGNLNAQLLLARSLLASGDLDRAASITRNLVAAAPQSGLVQTQAGMLALAKGDKPAARAAFEKALALDGGLVEALTALVAWDLNEKKPEQARARVEERLRKTPKHSALLVIAGRTYAATGDAAKGEEYLRQAIDANPSNLDAYAALAQLHFSQKKLDQAVAEYDKLAARQPLSVGPPTMAALIVQAQGKEAEARGRYERLVEAVPRAAVAANNLAWLYANHGEQLDRALQLAQAAKAELPDHPQINDTLGFVYLKKQLPSLAIPPMRLAVEKEPGNPSFHYRLGLAYSQTGDQAAARTELERALKLKPDFSGAEDARRVLATLK